MFGLKVLIAANYGHIVFLFSVCININAQILGQQPLVGANQFGNNAFNAPTGQSSLNADFNSAFGTPAPSSSNTNATPNLMDDLLTPERPASSSQDTTKRREEGRMTGDLNQGLERMAKSLGKPFLLFNNIKNNVQVFII